MTVLRTGWAWSFAVAITIPLSLIVLIAALLRVRNPRVYDWVGRSWARSILWASGTKVRAEGVEHFEPGHPHVIVSNHQSWYDVFALAAVIPGRYRFIAKKELARIPLFGLAWQAAGHVSIDRSNRQSAIRSIDQAGETVHRDHSSIVVFPEGTRSPTGDLLPFKKGAFMIALQTGIELIPVGVSGGRQVLRKGDWRVHKGEVIVRFGRPIPTVEYSLATRDALIERTRSEIQQLLAR